MQEKNRFQLRLFYITSNFKHSITANFCSAYFSMVLRNDISLGQRTLISVFSLYRLWHGQARRHKREMGGGGGKSSTVTRSNIIDFINNSKERKIANDIRRKSNNSGLKNLSSKFSFEKTQPISSTCQCCQGDKTITNAQLYTTIQYCCSVYEVLRTADAELRSLHAYIHRPKYSSIR